MVARFVLEPPGQGERLDRFVIGLGSRTSATARRPGSTASLRPAEKRESDSFVDQGECNREGAPISTKILRASVCLEVLFRNRIGNGLPDPQRKGTTPGPMVSPAYERLPLLRRGVWWRRRDGSSCSR